MGAAAQDYGKFVDRSLNKLLMGSSARRGRGIDSTVRAFRALVRKAVKRSDPQHSWRGTFALEIFSGSSRFAAADAKGGVPTVSLDIKDKPAFDITRKPLLAYISRRVLTGMVLFL